MQDPFIHKSDGSRIFGKITRNPKELNSYCKPLIGHHLLSVEKIDFTWFFRFTGDITLTTESLWRLIIKDRIVITSEDHNQQFGLPEPTDAAARVLSYIGSHTVESATISASIGDLNIELSGHAQLQLLQVSSGYESWKLCVQCNETSISLAVGTVTICSGGGAITHFPRD